MQETIYQAGKRASILGLLNRGLISFNGSEICQIRFLYNPLPSDSHWTILHFCAEHCVSETFIHAWLSPQHTLSFGFEVKKKAHFSMAGSVQVLNRLLEQALREGRKAGTSQVCIFLGLKAINVHLTHGFDLFSSNHLMLKWCTWKELRRETKKTFVSHFFKDVVVCQ